MVNIDDVKNVFLEDRNAGDCDDDDDRSSISSYGSHFSLNIGPVVHNDRKRNHHIAFRWLPKWTKISEDEGDAKYADWKVTVRYYHKDIHDDDDDDDDDASGKDEEQDAAATMMTQSSAYERSNVFSSSDHPCSSK